jgi:hypothetical protein
MKKHHKKIIASLSLALGAVSFNAHAQASDNKQYNVNPLELYSKVTSLTMAFNEKYGKEFRLPVNAKDSVDVILKHSDTKKYMGSKTYNGYSLDSKFSKEAHDMMNALANLVGDFKRIGFIREIKSQGKTPALMFDIDNTIELTSFDDDYFTKSGINDPSTAHFIKNVCFKDGIACYFITARTCNHNEASATKKWLQKHLSLTNEQVSKYVFLSGSMPANACTSKPNEKVAYKDVLRESLSQTRHVYWLMSIGDQMTDWFGKHSGLKVWYPNEMFDSSIVGNNGNDSNKKGVLKTVVAPTEGCYQKLKDKALTDSTIQYCQTFKKNTYV